MGHRAGIGGLFTVAVLLQSFSDFGARRGVSAVLRLRVGSAALGALPAVLAKYTHSALLSSSRTVDDGAEQTWQLRLPNAGAQAALLAALPEAGAADASMLLQDDSLEV